MTDGISGSGRADADVPSGSVSERGLSREVLDELLPDDFDWEEMVVRYPSPSLVVAAAAGFFVGYRHGAHIVHSVGSFLSTRVERAVDNLLGDV